MAWADARHLGGDSGAEVEGRVGGISGAGLSVEVPGTVGGHGRGRCLAVDRRL